MHSSKDKALQLKKIKPFLYILTSRTHWAMLHGALAYFFHRIVA